MGDPTRYAPPSQGSAWSRMPGVDATATAHAIRGLPLVRGLLAGAGADIACFHFEFARRHNGYRCTLWRPDGSGYQVASSAREITRAVLSEVCGALAPLARDLAARWPAMARPRVIGMATDGHCIVFNAGHPSCEGVEWLDQHILGRSPGVLLAGDPHKGPLGLIVSNREAQQ